MTTNELIDHVIAAADALPAHAAAAGRWATDNAWWMVLLSVTAATAVIWLRHRLATRALQNRSAYELLPATGFDPKLEDVIRFAKQLAGAAAASSRWKLRPARGAAVRVRLVSEGGPLSLRIEGHVRVLQVMRHQGYAQCELREVDADSTPRERPVIRLGARREAPAQAVA